MSITTKKNNHFTNLRWATSSENARNSTRPSTRTIMPPVDSNQEWRKIGQFSAYNLSQYGVSEKGDLKNGEHSLSDRPSIDGYVRNGLNCSTTNVSIIVSRHRLVAWAFKRRYYSEEKNVFHHVNVIKSDNHASNLRWLAFRKNLNFANVIAAEIFNEQGEKVDKYDSITKLLISRSHW